MRDRIARDYHDISYDVLWQVSEAIHAVMLERGNPCTAANVMQLVAGLTAVAAVAKSLFLRDIVLLRQPAVQQMMAGIFSARWAAGHLDRKSRVWARRQTIPSPQGVSDRAATAKN